MLVYMLLFLSVTVGITYRLQFQSYQQLHCRALAQTAVTLNAAAVTAP